MRNGNGGTLVVSFMYAHPVFKKQKYSNTEAFWVVGR
jgi:hypothetical protein